MKNLKNTSFPGNRDGGFDSGVKALELALDFFDKNQQPDSSQIKKIQRASQAYPPKINPYFYNLAKKHPAIAMQVAPSMHELADDGHDLDPFCEEERSPVSNLVHRHPDRVLFLVSDSCALHCRFCMRKRLSPPSSGSAPVSPCPETILQGIEYIRNSKQVREVILSGGDPLLLENAELEKILFDLSKIPHVKILRIHTRVPAALPMRIDSSLAMMLKKFHPLYMNLHFNHPEELTPEAVNACNLLADAGIPLGSQTVLLKGVNDSAETLSQLFVDLLKVRVRPYYLHYPDPVAGTSFFRPSMEKSLEILKTLHRELPGTAVPRFMVDLLGGHGKVEICPEHIKKNHEGKYSAHLPGNESICLDYIKD